MDITKGASYQKRKGAEPKKVGRAQKKRLYLKQNEKIVWQNRKICVFLNKIEVKMTVKR